MNKNNQIILTVRKQLWVKAKGETGLYLKKKNKESQVAGRNRNRLEDYSLESKCNPT